MALTKSTYSMIDGPVGNVKDFGALGNGTNQTAAIQAAVNAICAANGVLLFPPGNYRISAPITFPDASFRVVGSGPTETSIAQVVGGSNINLFDFSNVNGPSTFVEAMGFFGPASGSYGLAGIYLNASNGVCIQDCWFGGLATGVQKTNTSSFVRVLNCTFEFCFDAVAFDSSVECIVDNTTFYRNVNDYVLTGSSPASIFSNSTHLETVTKCIYLNGVKDAIIENVTCWQDSATNVPLIMNLVNTCQRNIVRNLKSFNFGSKLISMNASASNNNNLFDGLFFNITGTPPAGTGANAIEIGVTNQNNVFSNFNFSGLGIAIVDAGGDNRFINGIVNTSGTAGIRVQNATDSEFVGITLVNNFVDWATSGTVQTIWLADISGTVNGLTPQRYGSKGAGPLGRLFYGSTAPPLNTLSYLLGDRILNINPIVGQPKAWVCTVAGTPGTWVSEGNL
jgi:hypothetical protein